MKYHDLLLPLLFLMLGESIHMLMFIQSANVTLLFLAWEGLQSGIHGQRPDGHRERHRHQKAK